MKEKIFRSIFFIALVGIGIYYTYPSKITDLEKLAYLRSFGVTVGLTLGGISIGIVLGLLLAFIKFLNIKPVNFIIDEYIDILRGTPIILQLLIFSIVIFSTWSDNFYVAIIALGLNSSAYVAEIVRSGINSVDKGQMEAARSLGLPKSRAMVKVIIPQAIRIVIPSLVNQFIITLNRFFNHI